MSIQETNALCQQYLSMVYNDVHRHVASDYVETYGELLFSGVSKLLAKIKLNESDIFMDLGSGLGKIPAQVFLQSNVKEAYGIESVQERNQQAVLAAQKIQQDLPNFFNNNRKLIYLSGSFLDIPLTRATVVLVNGVCFGQQLTNAIGEVIENTPSIHTVLTLRPIATLKRLAFKKTVRVECSWDSALCYIYSNE
jgi:hypothetical protein